MTSDTITAPAARGLVTSQALNDVQQETLTDAGSQIQVEGLAKSLGATNALLEGREESQGNNAANAAAVEGAQLKVVLSTLTAGPKDLHADVAYGMLAGQDMLRSSTQAQQTDVSGMDSGLEWGILTQDSLSDLGCRNAGREGVEE
ncbi:hypothetical protein KXV48_009390 [Aspergillus fumigatus]|nr:hypothetical protein KXV48_009390 [Aspergillus fumigatus]